MIAEGQRGAERGWPALCEEHRGLPRINVLAKLSGKERDLVIAYHRVKIEKELADLETGHFKVDRFRLQPADARKSAKTRLAHLEHVVQVFAEINEELGLKAA